MSRRHWRGRLVAGALAGIVAARARAADTIQTSRFGMFGQSNEVFRGLVADPREIQLAAAYYRLNGINTSDVALGHSWGMARWSAGSNWLLQWDVDAMAYSRFRLSGAVNEFETVDFYGRLPVEVRCRWASGRLMLFHQSSHLGDDYIRRTSDAGFRYSVDGLRGQLSADLGPRARAYVGGIYLLHTIPSPDRGAFQTGLELRAGDLGLTKTYASSLYLAQDVQLNSNVAWNPNSRTVAGLRFGQRDGRKAIRLELGYFTGHSPYGQFFRQKEHYADVRMALEL